MPRSLLSYYIFKNIYMAITAAQVKELRERTQQRKLIEKLQNEQLE